MDDQLLLQTYQNNMKELNQANDNSFIKTHEMLTNKVITIMRNIFKFHKDIKFNLIFLE